MKEISAASHIRIEDKRLRIHF